jgi:elongation factor P--beta-lysine ligase
MINKKEELIEAMKENNIDLVESILNEDKNNNLTVNNDELFFYVINGKRMDLLFILLKNKKIDPTWCNNSAIRLASEEGRLDILELLLNDKRVNPSINNNSSIVVADSNNHTNVVKRLWKESSVKERFENYCLDFQRELYNKLKKRDMELKINNF